MGESFIGIVGAVLVVMIAGVECINNFADTACGIRHSRLSRVVGGQDAGQGEFPWLVSVTRRGGHFCGGSLLTNRHILTAGHCICSGIGSEMLKPRSLKITLGQHDLTQKTSDKYEMTVKEITTHPEYSCKKPSNDIALIELDKEVQWSESVSPACLPSLSEDGYDTYDNMIATVAGWGWTDEDNAKGQRANVLQKAKVNVIETKKCQIWYKSQGKKTKIQATQICAGHEQGGIDACWADSGGPLMITSNGQMVLIGVVSTGIGCARPYLPGLYTRVSEYIPWIKSIVSS